MNTTFLGDGAIRKLAMTIKLRKPRRVLLVTGKQSFSKSGARDIVMQTLGTTPSVRFTVSSCLPDIREVRRGIRRIRRKPVDLVVAVGGGKVIDVAKLISAIAKQHSPFLDLIHGRQHIRSRPIPLIAIPTTAGSGSEATQFAVVYRGETKHSLSHPWMLPCISIVDPQLTGQTPPRQTASSGLDALCQGIESYWAVGATRQSKQYAAKAIRLGLAGIARAVIAPDPISRRKMALAAHWAGRAINISRTTAPHALSYPLTVHHGVPHGQAVAAWLGPFCRLNSRAYVLPLNDPRGRSYVIRTLAALCRILGCHNLEEFAGQWEILVKRLGMQYRFGAGGMRALADMHRIMDNADANRLANNPVTVTRPMLRQLAMDAMSK